MRHVSVFYRATGLHDKFMWLLKMHLLDHEKVRLADDETMAKLTSAPVREVLAKYKTQLRKIHTRYGKQEARLVSSPAQPQQPNTKHKPRLDGPSSALRS